MTSCQIWLIEATDLYVYAGSFGYRILQPLSILETIHKLLKCYALRKLNRTLVRGVGSPVRTCQVSLSVDRGALAQTPQWQGS
jgi:hypothetical protein